MTQTQLHTALSSEAVQLLSDYQAAYGSLSLEQLNWKPGPKQWSVAQVLHHLCRQEKPYPALLAAGIAKAPLRPGDQPFSYSWVGKKITAMLAPGARRIPAPPILQPTHTTYDRSIIASFEALQAQYLSLITQATDRDLMRGKVRWAVFPLVTFRLGEAFRVLLVHKQRHLAQIHRVLTAPGFPAA
jgi:DinB superfamily